jgi:hypothetical protein
MSLAQRIQDEEKRKQNEKAQAQADEEASRKKAKEIVRTNPTKLECKKLIPVVQSILKELSKSFGYIVEEGVSKENSYFYFEQNLSVNISGLYTYNVFKAYYKYGIFPTKKGKLLELTIGYARIDNQFQVTVIPIIINYYRAVRTETESSQGTSFSTRWDRTFLASYKLTSSGINEQNVKQWLEDILFENKDKIGLEIQK